VTIKDADGQVAALFQMLAEPARLSAIQALSNGPRRAGQLAEAAHLSAPAMSKHLRVLLEAGLVSDERRPEDARLRVFRLRPEPIIALRAWLDQLQAHWDEQLLSFRRHVEGEAR
jgi:DNA-binding transcriptional ArsR family regulator